MKNIVIRIVVLVLLLVVSNFIYSKWFFEKDLQKYAPDINLIRKVTEEKATVIYCGESSNISTYSKDTNKLYISEFLSQILPNQKVVDFTKKASHAGIFYELLRAIPENGSLKTVIVTMNLRSFGPDWINSNLETALQKDLVLLRPFPPLVNRFLLGFKNYDTTPANLREKNYKRHLDYDALNLSPDFPYRTASEWETDIIKNGKKVNKTLNSIENRSLASQYIKSYAFRINTETNPRIEDFDKIVELGENRNWKIVFHILPENVDRANELVGEELVQMIRENRELLKIRYSKSSIIVVDNLDLLPSEQFIDQDWTTEHYKEFGRKTIAEKIAKFLKP